MKFDDFLKEQLKDSEFKKEYDSLEVEYNVINQIIKTRLEKNMTQGELAKKLVRR